MVVQVQLIISIVIMKISITSDIQKYVHMARIMMLKTLLYQMILRKHQCGKQEECERESRNAVQDGQVAVQHGSINNCFIMLSFVDYHLSV